MELNPVPDSEVGFYYITSSLHQRKIKEKCRLCRIYTSHFKGCTVIRFVRVSAKFGTCTVVSVKETLVEAKMCTFTLESTHFIFNMCPIYTHDGAITVWQDFVYRYTNVLRGSQRNVLSEILPLIQRNVDFGMFVKYMPSYVFD
jgi:hypothetical protein